MSQLVTFEKLNNIAVITIDNPPVNALGQAVRQGLVNAVDSLQDSADLDAAVLICAGRTFIAGADIREFGKPPVEPFTPDVTLKIGASSKPIVAAMHGTVLGGGFEVALACHLRVAQRGTKVGFPEVKLGLIPGAGGTQLLPRLAGVATTLDLITSGRHVAVESETGQKLIDELVNDDSHEELLASAIDAAKNAASQNNIRRLADEVIPQNDEHDKVFEEYRAQMVKKQRGVMAAQKCIDSIGNAVLLPFDEGITRERSLFQECRKSSQSGAMRHAFFAERSCAKIDDVDTSIKARPLDSVAVVGAGWMGVGISICFADAGIPVILLDVNEDMIETGLAKVRGNYERSVSRGRISSSELEKRCARIEGTTDYSELADVDLVIEAAFESMDVKHTIFKRLDQVCKDDAVLATNTSYLDINEIAAATTRSDRVIGMHFFSPAHIMKLLEVVRASNTSDQTLLSVIALGKRLRKIPVTVGVCYGFAGNRIYARYGAEAQNLLLEGATPDQVDLAMRNWGMAMGPLQVIDLTGLDIGYKARQHQPNLPDAPSYFALSKVFVESGRLGQKSDAGFYRYKEGQRQIDEQSLEIIRETSAELGVEQREFDDEQICNRLISSIVDEGRAVLEEGIVQRASDIDVIWLNGYGFPRFRGGPMWYADEIGL